MPKKPNNTAKNSNNANKPNITETFGSPKNSQKNKKLMNKKMLNGGFVLVLLLVISITAGVLIWYFSDTADLTYIVDFNAATFRVVQTGERTPDPTRPPNQITIGADGVTGNVNPMHAVTEADVLAATIIFEPLAKVMPNGQIMPLLAETLDISADGLTYTFYLMDNVVFSDGTPLTAEIILQNYLMFSNIAVETAHTVYLSRLNGFNQFRMGLSDTISGIVPNGNSIAFTFDIPLNSNVSAFLVPISHNGLGTGAFFMENFDAGGDTITLAANPNYHGGAPQLETIFIRSANVASAPVLLEWGNIDLFWTDYNHTLLQQLLPFTNISIGIFSGNQQGYIGFNYNNPHLANANIRKALVLSANAAAVTEQFFGEFAQAASHIVPPYFWLSGSPPLLPVFDPARATELLQEEGFYLNNAGFFEQNGEQLTFTLYTINSEMAWNLTDAIAANWRELGINVIVQALSFTNLRNAIETGDFDMMYLTMRIDFNTDFTNFTNENVLINPFSWNNPQAAQLATEINQPNQQQAMQAFSDWQRIYHENNVRLHLERPHRLVFFNPNLTGIFPYSYGNFTWNIHNWGVLQ
ncbi:MAG: ABC transporter substrate-binding protein [Defluviitaleaceae bacterium]|nr:ABC transporter substrate-binding protein [Defluviitaleaceae bacterium]